MNQPPFPLSIWKEMRVSEIGRVVSGATPSTSTSENWNGEIAWITPVDLSGLPTRYLSSTERSLTKLGLANCAAKLSPPQSLVISSRAPIGYMALPLVKFCTNQGCKTIEFFDGQQPDFHYYNFRFWVRRLHDKGEGTTFSEISKTTLEKVLVPVPLDGNVQKAIASVLAQMDRAIEYTQGMLAKQQRIKIGMMNDLLTRGIDAQGRLRDPTTDQFEKSPIGFISKEWECPKVADCLVDIEQGWSPDCPDEVASVNEWGVIKTTAVVWEGYFPSENKVLPNKFAPKRHLEIKYRDILMTRAGPSSRVGVVAYVSETRPRLILSDKIYRLVPKDGVLPEFLALALSADGYQRQLSQRKTGMAESQANISQDIVKELRIPKPTPQEQLVIVETIRKQREAIEESSEQLRKLRRLRDGLMQDLLTGRVPVTPLINSNL